MRFQKVKQIDQSPTASGYLHKHLHLHSLEPKVLSHTMLWDGGLSTCAHLFLIFTHMLTLLGCLQGGWGWRTGVSGGRDHIERTHRSW